MTERTTPTIGDPPKDPTKIKITKSEVLAFLKKKNLPFTRRTRKTARAKLRKRKERKARPRGKDVAYNGGPEHPWEFFYGELRIGGIFSFLKTTNAKKWLCHRITLAAHEIEDILEARLDENKVTEWENSTTWGWAQAGETPDGKPLDLLNKVFVRKYKGTASQTSGDLTGVIPDYWTSDHRQRGRAGVDVILVWNATLFPEGPPDLSFLARGKKVYDPRTSATAYSNNAALCIADYITDSTLGLGYPLSAIDTSDEPGGLEWAADICDEDVDLANGGTEKRYTCNALFTADMTPEEILSQMESAFGGFVTYSGGKWKFWPGAYVEPEITLTEDDLRGAVQLETLPARRDYFNGLRGTFVSADNNYEVTDFPAIAPPQYLAEDNNKRVWEDIDLPCSTSGTMAQRIGRITLEEVRRGITFSAPFSLRALPLEAGDTVKLDMDRYGFSDKVFRVLDTTFSCGEDLEILIHLTLREIDANAYAWDETVDEQQMTQSPPTQLPNPFDVEPPSNVQLASGTAHVLPKSDGTILPRLHVSWTAPDDGFVTEGGKIELQFRRNGTSAWSDVREVSGESTEAYILEVEEGKRYDVRLRAANAIGAKSAYVTKLNHLVLGKLAPPSNVEGFTYQIHLYGVLLRWNHISDPDRRDYEIRVGGASWNDAEHLTFVSGSSYLWEFTTAGTYTIRIKAYDTSGNPSDNDTTLTVEIIAPSEVRELKARQIGATLTLDWIEPSAGSFPISHYVIKKGATFEDAAVAGQVDGTFGTTVETIAGTYTYWVYAVDASGNIGTERSIDVTISTPTNFVARVNDALDLSKHIGDSFNITASENQIIAPLDTSMTYEEHFIDNGVTDPASSYQDLIDAGVDSYLEMIPTSATREVRSTFLEAYLRTDADTWQDWIDDAEIETLEDLFIFELEEENVRARWMKIVDFEVEFPSANLSVGIDSTALVGDIEIDVRLRISSDYREWTEIEGQQAVGESFRYLWLEILFRSDETIEQSQIDEIRVIVDVEKRDDFGTANLLAADSNGTTVSFSVGFLDVDVITLTPQGSTPVVLTYEFDDVPNPTSFRAFAFDIDGNRVDRAIGWKAEGI